MYVPSSFAQTDPTALFDLIEAHSFGLLISGTDGVRDVSHLPMLLDRGVVPHGGIVGHMARANAQWRAMDGREVLCVFSGPHAYVSPTWYEADGMVPTWNYLAVHVRGTCRVIEAGPRLTEIVADYVNTYERSMAVPWQLDTSNNTFAALLKSIVGFEVDVTRIEGKWKLGQNHPPERRDNAARHLAERADPGAQKIARLMRATLD